MVQFGHTLNITAAPGLVWYTDVQAQLYEKTGNSWNPLTSKTYNVSRDAALTQLGEWRNYKWSASYVFPAQGKTRVLAVVYYWMDNMNLTNWVGMADASTQLNATHWSHEIRWSQTFSFPEPPPITSPPHDNLDPMPLIIGVLALMIVVVVIVYRSEKNYGVI
jgi:hypothetical protein